MEEIPISIPTPSEILFFPAPNYDGTFQNTWGIKSFKNGSSVYQFKLVSHDTANFWVIENPDVFGRAIVSYKSILLPVCEEMNAISENHTKIMNKGIGVARLNSDVWEVTTKAKIRYE